MQETPLTNSHLHLNYVIKLYNVSIIKIFFFFIEFEPLEFWYRRLEVYEQTERCYKDSIRSINALNP